MQMKRTEILNTMDSIKYLFLHVHNLMKNPTVYCKKCNQLSLDQYLFKFLILIIKAIA